MIEIEDDEENQKDVATNDDGRGEKLHYDDCSNEDPLK